jgi:hypothetical protein
MQPALTEDQLGNVAVRLALSFPEWLQRRVEHVSYLDQRTVRQAEGVMFQWPQPEFFAEGARPEPGQMVYVPLDLLTKEPLAGLEGTRPDGSPFPILPFERTARLASAGITAFVWGEAKKHKQSLGRESLQIIDAIVTSAPAIATALLDVITNEHSELGKALPLHTEVRGLLEELATSVLLLAPAVYEPGEEVVYRYGYCRVLPKRPERRRLRIMLGLADIDVEHQGLSLGWGKTYHFEVDAPAGVRLSRARLYGTYACGPGEPVTALIAEDGEGPLVDLHALRPIDAAFKTADPEKPPYRPPLLPTIPASATPAQLLLAARQGKATSTDRSDNGYAEIRFRVEPFGTFLAAMVISVLTALLLLVARTRLPELDGQISSALLLALPIVTLGYLTSAGEHSFATRLLGGIRAMALAVGVLSLLVAAVLSGGFLHHTTAVPPSYACTGALTRADAAASSHLIHADRSSYLPAASSWHHRTHQTGPPGRHAIPVSNAKLVCKGGRPGSEATTVPRGIRIIVDLATTLAVILAAALLIGWLSTWRRSTGRLRDAKAG